jgi:hypothetical protein
MIKPKVLLNTYSRKIDLLFKPQDFARLNEVADLVWAKDEQAPDDVIGACKDDVEMVITGRWSYGDVDRFPKLKAILRQVGRRPDPTLWTINPVFREGFEY